MISDSLLGHRAERFVAAARMLLAGASWFAVTLDPATPASNATLTYSLLGLYFVYSVGVWGFGSRADVIPGRYAVALHVIDLCVYGVLVALTEGYASPFFAFFTFALLAAALRWNVKGTIWTAAVVIGIYLAIGFLGSRVLARPDFELNRFIIRGVYLVVVALLIADLVRYQQRLRTELEQLSRWSPPSLDDLPTLAAGALERIVPVLGARRLAIVWEPRDRALRDGAPPKCVQWSEAGLVIPAAPPRSVADLMLAGRMPDGLVCAGPSKPLMARTSEGEWRVLPAWPLDLAWGTYLDVLDRPSVMCRLDGRRFIGLLVIHKETPTSDDLTAAKIVAHLLAERFDLYYLLESARVSAATQERVTMARDLHDGLLQVLSGMALQMQAIAQRIRLDPGLAIDQITHLQKLVQSEQRDLRRLVDELTPAETPGDGAFELPARLEDLSVRMSRDWPLLVSVRFSPNGRALDSVTALQAYRLVHEALMNVVWHARATTVTVDVTLDAGELGMTIEDNGCGFAIRGDHDLDQLEAMAAGPYSIRERVRRLKGRMRLQSAPDGSRLSIYLPLLARR